MLLCASVGLTACSGLDFTAFNRQTSGNAKNALTWTATEPSSGQGDSPTQPSGPDPAAVDPESIPDYSGSPYVAINDNTPYFSEEDLTTDAFEEYSELDALGRCGTDYANICEELMPTEERGNISSVKPTGWHSVTYDGIDGGSLYNRCHLIGWQLSGEDANEENLITGTRYMNVQGMLPFENMVADYVEEEDAHVLYRVTPVFEGENLVASGVLMEAESVEDEGDSILFCVYCYNVQPGIEIDYATGDSRPEETSSQEESEETKEYILNTNTMKFHEPDCPSAGTIAEKNKRTVNESRDELISEGYLPCGRCEP